jgi:ATP-dependent DNA ligase
VSPSEQRNALRGRAGAGLEGIVAKRLSSRYSPAVRGWVKVKNRSYWRYELERESAINKGRQRLFV